MRSANFHVLVGGAKLHPAAPAGNDLAPVAVDQLQPSRQAPAHWCAGRLGRFRSAEAAPALFAPHAGRRFGINDPIAAHCDEGYLVVLRRPLCCHQSFAGVVTHRFGIPLDRVADASAARAPSGEDVAGTDRGEGLGWWRLAGPKAFRP